MEVHFGSVRVHSLTLFALSGACEDSRASLLALNLASLCLGWELKVRVATNDQTMWDMFFQGTT
jgi:hypothetical protein